MNTKWIISTQTRQKITVSVVCLDDFLFIDMMEITYASSIVETKWVLVLNLVCGIKVSLSVARMELSSTHCH